MTIYRTGFRCAGAVLAIVVGGGALTGCGLLPRPRGLARRPQGMPATRAKLAKVKVGMTVDQVVAIFGSQGHMAKGTTPATTPFMSWTNQDLTAAIVMFDKGRVTQVMRVGGLK